MMTVYENIKIFIGRAFGFKSKRGMSHAGLVLVREGQFLAVDEKEEKKYSELSYLHLGSNISGNKLFCIFLLKFQISHLCVRLFFFIEYSNFIK